MTVETAPKPDQSPGPPPADGEPVRNGKWILLVCCVAQFMVILDLSIVNIALPHIQNALNISSAALPWVIDAYAIMFASFLMLAGRAADRLGQRRVFIFALVLFGVTSMVGGVAQTGTMLFV